MCKNCIQELKSGQKIYIAKHNSFGNTYLNERIIDKVEKTETKDGHFRWRYTIKGADQLQAKNILNDIDTWLELNLQEGCYDTLKEAIEYLITEIEKDIKFNTENNIQMGIRIKELQKKLEELEN